VARASSLSPRSETAPRDRAAIELAVDAFYFSHDEWPKGKQFVIGHALLTSMFLFLTITFWSVVVRTYL